MNRDFKKVTPWVFTGEGTVVRYEYGFTCMRGNRGPYFSITGEEWAAHRGETPLPAGRDCISCGCLHSGLPDDLKAAVPFHLFDPTYGPMHYEANALYNLGLATGEYDGTLHAPKEWDPDPMACFKSGVCWGALSTDTEFELESLRRISRDGWKLWLDNRLPLLRMRFLETVVHGLKLKSEYRKAMAEYEPVLKLHGADFAKPEKE